jgi:hypothetical protein
MPTTGAVGGIPATAALARTALNINTGMSCQEIFNTGIPSFFVDLFAPA